MTVILDAGVLIGIDRRERAVGALLRVAQRERLAVGTSAAVVAQVWRGGSRQANLARVLTGVDVAPLDARDGRTVGEIMARSGAADVVDGHLALLARDGDVVLTSDPADLETLLRTRGVRTSVMRI